MATGRKTVVVGQVIDPVTWGNPLWDQSVQTFASAADRTAQFPAPLKGAKTYLEDVARWEGWDGTRWVPEVVFIPPGGWPAPVVGANNGKPMETFSWTFTASTNAGGDVNLNIPAGLTLASIYYLNVVGRGSTAFPITAFFYGVSNLTAPSVRLYNAGTPAASTSVAIAVTLTGQRA
ncbi:hypothetical protein [Cellulomonas sp. URHB0016]